MAVDNPSNVRFSNRPVGALHWEKNGEPGLTLDELLERSEVVTIGIDGGGLDDLLGLSVLGRAREAETDTKSHQWLHWGHAWAHESVMERRKDIATRLRDFEADGDLTIVKRVGDDVIALRSGLASMLRPASSSTMARRCRPGPRRSRLCRATGRRRAPARRYRPLRRSWLGRSATPGSRRAATRSLSPNKPPVPRRSIRWRRCSMRSH